MQCYIRNTRLPTGAPRCLGGAAEVGDANAVDPRCGEQMEVFGGQVAVADGALQVDAIACPVEGFGGRGFRYGRG